MTKFVLTYGGELGMPGGEAEQADVMAAWGAWFGQLGAAVVDPGNPFAQARTIAADGSVSEAATRTGYTVLQADTIDDAVVLAKGCPVLSSGGTVEVSEAIDM